MMNTLFPDYYETFHCTADACPITCCQEWKINVDSDTQKRWATLSVPSGLSIQKPALTDYIVEKDGQSVIGLTPTHRCPFLAENKLCHLVLTHGDSALSETCTIFPRESHEFSTHIEKTLMPCCPAVIDLWAQSGTISFPDPTVLLSYSNDSAHPTPSSHPVPPIPTIFSSSSSNLGNTEFLLFQIRREMIHAIKDNTQLTIEETLLELFYILFELDRQPALSSDLIKEYFSDENHRALCEAISKIELPPADTLEECNELLQDLAVNYENEGLYQNFLTPILNFARNECSNKKDLPLLWKHFQNTLAPFEDLFRCFLANEFYSDLVLPDYSLEEMILKLQWIAIEYTAIRQSLFLSWLHQSSLSYSLIRQAIVILTRMTGYEDEDIFSYLENSFESPFWDWVYFALIVGRV